MVVPFLYELRNVMDWMWTDSSVALYHWMEVEDVFCKIFVLKCWRYAELRWPTARGINSRFYAKYIIGGFLLVILFICLWGPLAVSSFIGRTFVKNPPIECSFSINVGGYSVIKYALKDAYLFHFQPLFVFSSRENYLRPLAEEKFLQMKECYQHYTVICNIIFCPLTGYGIYLTYCIMSGMRHWWKTVNELPQVPVVMW